MVIRGRTRGNGKQLASYLMAAGENDAVQILNVNGRVQANDNYLRRTLLCMSLTSELTKSHNGLYHAQINPAYGEDKKMDAQAWLQAADILGKELGLEGQQRVIVLHTKKGRTHAHVVWERYDHEKKKMKPDSYSRLAQDRARKEMERVFEQQQTPDRNPLRPEMKQRLTELWQQSRTGNEFIAAAKAEGYVVATGTQRPFMVVDDTGRSFDLVRQLDGIKTKDVRERLKTEKLATEKDAIALVRQRQKLEAVKDKEAAVTAAVNDNAVAKKTAQLFAETRKGITADMQDNAFDVRKKAVADQFLATGKTVTQPERPAEAPDWQSLANAFADNRNEQLATQDEKELRREAFRQKMNTKKDKEKGNDPSVDFD